MTLRELIGGGSARDYGVAAANAFSNAVKVLNGEKPENNNTVEQSTTTTKFLNPSDSISDNEEAGNDE